uniref:CSON009984 protein n=1 Tax=Culicoides sonorensis TaxID=179676 RepID=A0A336LLB9_CULSO
MNVTRSDDHSSPGFERNFYERKRDTRILSSSQLECNQIDSSNSLITATGTTTIQSTAPHQFHSSIPHTRRPIHNTYHTSCNLSSSPSGSINDVVVVRGRARDRHYTSNRNGSYSSCVDRSTPIGHPRLSSNNWYESSSSSSSRNLYGNSVGIKNDSTYETPHLERSNSVRSTSDLLDTSVNNLSNSKSRHHSTTSISHRHSSTSSSHQSHSSSHHNNNSHSSRVTQHHHISKKKKSRSGSGSPCSTSSRSRSHSRSSCTSTNSETSNESGASPVPGSGRNLQSAIGVAPICNSSSSSLAGSSAGSSSSHHHLVDDNRAFAIRVRNLPVRSSDTSIKDGLFHEYKKNGKVTWVKVSGENIDRYAIVCFKKAEDAEKALEDSKDKLFFGCRIDVELYQGYDLQDSDFRAFEAELDEYHPKATRTLFIGNLEKDITASELRKYFDCFGEIIDIDIKKQGLTAYAFCQYSNIVSVVKAMRKMDGEHLGNNRIKLGFGKSMHTNCVWIDGVADSITENNLITQFSRFGPVEGVTIDRERKLALITFEQNQNAQLAVKEMRGTTLRNRKIQIDFASRECQTAFYEKLSNSTSNSSNIIKKKSVSERANSFDTTINVPGSRSYNNSSRYENASSTISSSRGRASSFSRPNNPLSGAASPSSTTSGGVTRPRQIRYTSTTTDYYSSNNDVDVPMTHDKRFRSYDEYSQGSGASHEDLYDATSNCGSIRGGSISRDHVESPQSRLGSVISSVGDNSGNSNLYINNSSSCNNIRLANNNDEVSTTTINNLSAIRRRGSDKSPGDIKHLQKERVHLLEQLEECPSSGDEQISPKKRRYGSNYVIDHSTTNNNNSNHEYTNNIEHNNLPNNESHGNHHYHHSLSTSSLHHSMHPHRKGVEIRRLSEASLKQHTATSQLQSSCSTNNINSNNNVNRRPSTDSLSRSSSIIDHTFSGGVTSSFNSSLSKRRKTSANDDHHSSSGRGHRLHSMHSHEASGGESADGSRPGTPLCDEPSEPRRLPRERSHEPMVLPLPKFAEQFFIKLRKEQQTSTNHRDPFSSTSSSSHASSQQQGVSSNTSATKEIIPVPLALQSSTNISVSSNSSLNILNSNNHSTSSALTSPQALFSPNLHHRHGSVSSGSSSSNITAISNMTQYNTANPPNSVPTAPTEHVPTSPNNTRPPSLPSSNSSDSETEVRNPLLEESLEERLKSLDEKYEKWSGGSGSHRRSHGDSGNNGSAGYRHKLLELDVKEVQPSEIVKTLLAKKSIFDDDSKRLENIGDKYEPREFSNYARTISVVPLVTAASAIPIQTKPATPPISIPSSAIPPNLSQIHQQRLVGNNSPMRSPPYTSPQSNSSCGSSSTTPVIKQLQYPFPSHPPTAGVSITTNTTSMSASSCSSTITTVAQSTQPITSSGTSTSIVEKVKSTPVAKISTESQPIKPNNSTNTSTASNRVLTKSASLPTGVAAHINEHNAEENNKNENEHGKSYKDRRKISLQEETSDHKPSVSVIADPKQKQQQEAEIKRSEQVEREKRELEQRRLAEKKEQERQEKARKEKEESERRVKEEKARHQAMVEQQKQREEKVSNEERLTKESNQVERIQHKERSHNHKYNNSASTSPVRSSNNNNKRRLSSPDAPLTNHLENSINTENVKKSKSEQEHHKSSQDIKKESSKEISLSNKGTSLSSEKTPTKHHNKKNEDRSSNKDVVSSPEEKHHSQDKDTLFDYLRSEHNPNKNEKHHNMKNNRKHSSTTMPLVKDEVIHKELQRDKENTQTENSMDNKAFFDAIELRSSEEEERLRAIRRETKERKDSQDTNKSTTSGNSGDEPSSHSHSKHHDSCRKSSRSDNHPSSDDVTGSCSKKQRSKTSRRNTVPDTSHHHHHHSHSHTSDETDSDGRKKHSIFDIPDEGPYVSMYDKVKARSCKNMQKQEEEKKIKAKFSKLKRSRAKREGKKRSTSWDEDSDTDDDEPRYSRVNNKGLMSSSDDEIHMHRNSMLSDSDQEKLHFNRNRLHDICGEGESSDATHFTNQSKPRRKISSRKNSRATRMALDSSDEDSNIKTVIKTELKTEMISEDDDHIKPELKLEAGSTIKQEIKEEITVSTPVSAPAIIESKSPFDQIFGHDSKKKHKKNKKRQKSFPMDSTDEDILPLSERRDTEGEVLSTSNKNAEIEQHDRRTKHGSKKEKKREKTREEHERKKARKASKLLERQHIENKREEKMEDIFGAFSDEESRSPTENLVSPSTSATKANAFDQLREPVNQNRNSKSSDHDHNLESRKLKREKKRREKHKTGTHTKEDENSVDLDEAGRALEAQLMSDTEIKTEVAQKSNNDNADVFRFSDGDDSLDSTKKEVSEHRREKKKKKKKSKEEKHKHHHHKNHDDKLLSPEPSLPSLLDDLTSSSENQKKSTVPHRGNGMTSPLAIDHKTKSFENSPNKIDDTLNNKQQRKQADVFIPGFGGKIDEKIHESAIQSIAQELEKTDNVIPTDQSTSLDKDRPESPKALDGKCDEKSRVIISQEETEDAVAALLGESFGTNNVPDYDEIFEEPVEEPPSLQEEAVLPEQDDEEMKKAIQSLNADEMDIKADTPQSEHDLQIDTDTEEQEEQEKSAQFDNPPKTPDVDFAQIRKNAAEKLEQEKNVKPAISPLVASETKPVIPKEDIQKKKLPVIIPQVKFIPATSITTEASKKPQQLTVLQPPTIKIPENQDPIKSSNTLLSPRKVSIPNPLGVNKTQISPHQVNKDQSQCTNSQQLETGRKMLSPTKTHTTTSGPVIFHSSPSGQSRIPPVNMQGPLNRFPIAQVPVSKPIQPTNVMLSQPSQGTLSSNTPQKQVHITGPGQKPETIFIHQQQTPRGSIQVVHHQVNVGPGPSTQQFQIPHQVNKDQSQCTNSQQLETGRKMLSPTKTHTTTSGPVIFHSSPSGQSRIPPVNMQGPLNRFPIAQVPVSKPIQPTNVMLSQPSQGTLSSNTPQKQVHITGPGQKPETIFIHQQQTPRGSIQVVHHQVNVGPGPSTQQFQMYPQNQSHSHPQPKQENPSIFVQQAPNLQNVDKQDKPSSSALFDKLKASSDVNPQRLSPVKDDKKSDNDTMTEHEQPTHVHESKEDSDCWSANIDNVLQLLNEEDTASDNNSKVDVSEKHKQADQTSNEPPENKTQVGESDKNIVAEVIDKETIPGKVKGKVGRKRKNTASEGDLTKPAIVVEKVLEATTVSNIQTIANAEDNQGVVQTRNTRNTNNPKPVQGKRGANTRGNRGKTAGQAGSKQRNQNSESDVYEFHDDSSDDATGKSIEAAKSVQVQKLVVAPVNTAEQPSQTPSIVNSNQELEKLHQIPIHGPNSPNVMTEVREEFLSPQSAANTRKSRRLQERDGSRSTVDDIIEDVVRNSTTQSPKNSPLRQPPSPADPSTVNQIRRTTRQNNLVVPLEKQNLADVRKSPRAGTSTTKKNRKTSETSIESSSDEAKIKMEIKPEIKSETSVSFNEVSNDIIPMNQIVKEEKVVVMKTKEEIPIRTTPPTSMIEPLPPKQMQYKPIPIEKPPTPIQSTPSQSPKPQVSCSMIQPTVSTSPVIVNLPPGSVPPNNVQKHPPNTTIHLPMHPQSEIKVVPLPNPPTSQATAVIQHTPISVQQAISQKQPVTITQTTYPNNPKHNVMQPQMHQQQQQSSIKHIPIIEQQQQQKQGQPSQTVVKICGPPNSGPHVTQQQQQMPAGAIIKKHGSIQQQMHGPSGNLIINIPPGSVPPSQQQQQSPRMQHSQHIITNKQGMPHGNVQILQQNKQPSQSPGPMIQPGQQQQQQQQQQAQMMIHGKPVQIQAPAGYTTVFQGTKIIHQGPGGHSQGPQIHQGPTGKQYQVQQIQLTNLPPGQPLPQGTIVTQQQIKMNKSGELQIPSQQQLHVPNKPPTPQSHLNQQQMHISQKPQQQQHLIQTKGGSITIQQAQTPPGIHNKQMAASQQMQHQPQMQVKGNLIGLHQAPQILTGAVASPPLKHSHVQSQQPIVAGASSSRVQAPTMSPQGRALTLQAGLPVSAFEPNLHREKNVYSSVSAHSPPPAHQQASPITPNDGNFPPGQLRAVPREYYHHNFMYQQHVQRQQEALAANARLPPHLPRSPMLPGTAEPGMSEVNESMVASPPLELRRPASGPRITSVPLSLQSPGDRATDSPLVYIHGARVPHYPHDPNIPRFYDSQGRQIVEPPPAHRSNAPTSSQFVGSTPPPQATMPLCHIQRDVRGRDERDVRVRDEREVRGRDDRERGLPGNNAAGNSNTRVAVIRPSSQQQQDSQLLLVGHTNIPPHAGLVPAMPELSTRGMQIATPPHGSQVPHQAESLHSLLQRYPVMWQGLLALKNDQAAVQMHFVYGSRDVAEKSLPRNGDNTTPPLRIAQRMRLEPAQIDGVARKMQIENEHCMLLALPCGHDHMDVLLQSNNLTSGFITYLQQKQAAGIVNIAEPGSQQAAYVVHIFPSCEFANESLTRIAPDLLHRVQDIAHLLIVIATV